MDPTLWRDVDAGSAVLFFVIVIAVPLLAMLFNPSPHDEADYVDDRQGLGEIEDDLGLNGPVS
jgi:hypothetical protein